MTPRDLEPRAGERRKVFPRTLSLGNWPFLVLLVLVASVAATPMVLDGRWGAALLIVGAIAIVPALVGLMQVWSEATGHRTLAAIHEKGIVWRRLWSTGFVPWEDVLRVEQRVVESEGFTLVVWDVHVRDDGRKPIFIDDTSGGEASAEEIASRIAALATA